MSNIFPLCPCPDEEDPRIQCFKKSIKNNKNKCDKKLFPYYKNIIEKIKDIFENSITAIERIENIKLKNPSKDYVTESLPMFEEFENAIEKYIEYRDQIKKEEEYLNVQECFYVNCNKEIREQMKQYTEFIQLFKNFLSERNKQFQNKINTELESQHDKLIDKVIKTIIALYADEVEEYQRRFIAVSPEKKNKKQNFDKDENREDDEEDPHKDKDKGKKEEEEDEIEDYDDEEDPHKDKDKGKEEEEEEDEIEDYDDEEDTHKNKDKGKKEEDDEEDPNKDKGKKIQKYSCKSNSNCQLLKNCLTQTEKFDNPCECVNNNSDNNQSKKKACQILGPCKYNHEECTKRGIKIDFSYNNFCEGIEDLEDKITEKTRCSRNKKIQKNISSIFKYKDTKETCPSITSNSITKDCVKILDKGKECCINYFKKKEKFFNQSKDKNKHWEKIKTTVKSKSNLKKSGNELREKDKKDREKSKTQKAGYKNQTKKLQIWKQLF